MADLVATDALLVASPTTVAPKPTGILEFPEVLYRTKDLKKFIPDMYFNQFDYVEQYDEKKKYELGTFSARYRGGILKRYRNVLYVIHGGYDYVSTPEEPHVKTGKSRGELKFVVAREVLSVEEIERMKPYCQCNYHKQRRWFDFGWLFTSPIYSGCLQTEFYTQETINRTRSLVQSKYGRSI